MALKAPYQPLMLRLLHGAVAVLVPIAWLSGLAVLLNHDPRLQLLRWSLPGDWIDLHGTAGAVLWPLALLFGLYCLTAGRRRLRQPANAAALLALALAVISGKAMNEDWLRQGQLDHVAYHLHVLAWLVLSAIVIWHVLTVLQRGGLRLARSMFSTQIR